MTRRLLTMLILLTAIAGCERAPTSANEDPTTPDEKQPQLAEAPATQDWPTSRGDPQLTGVSSIALPESFELRWTFEVGEPIASSPVVVDDHVYFGADDGVVRCVRDGVLVWSFETEYLIEASPFVHDGVVYVGSHDFFMYALDASTGEELWRFETEEKIVGGATMVEGPEGEILVFGSHDFRVYGLDAKTGSEIWRYQTNERVNATPARAGSTVFVGGCDTLLHQIDGRTGEATTTLELGGECHIIASVAIADGAAYFGHHDKAFISVDLESNEIVWEYVARRFGFAGPAAVTDGLVVFGGRDSHLHAANRATGEPVWTFATRRKVDAGPLVGGDRVVFGSADGRLSMLDLADGALRWQYDIGASILTSPAFTGSMMYVGANDGRLYAFGVPDG